MFAKKENIYYPRCLFASAFLGKTKIFAGGVDESGKVNDTV